MTQARIYKFPTGERLDLHLVEPPQLTPSEQSIHLADAVAEHYRSEEAYRRLGLISIETVNGEQV